MPKSMLQGFGLIRHPETSDVWWIPEGLDERRKPANEESDEADDPSSIAAKDDVDRESTAEKQTSHRYPSYVLARQDLIQNFVEPGNKYYGGHHRLAGNPHAPSVAKSASWRSDMDMVILDQRRRRIMDDLLDLSTLCQEAGRKYIIRVAAAKYAATYVHRAAFLWLGEEKTPDSGEDSQGPTSEAEKADFDPQQYATLDIDDNPTTTRPVYNLPRLLGPVNVARLRAESSVLREGSLFLLRSQRSGELNMKLWSLQGYMADYTKL